MKLRYFHERLNESNSLKKNCYQIKGSQDNQKSQEWDVNNVEVSGTQRDWQYV